MERPVKAGAVIVVSVKNLHGIPVTIDDDRSSN